MEQNQQSCQGGPYQPQQPCQEGQYVPPAYFQPELQPAPKTHKKKGGAVAVVICICIAAVAAGVILIRGAGQSGKKVRDWNADKTSSEIDAREEHIQRPETGAVEKDGYAEVDNHCTGLWLNGEYLETLAFLNEVVAENESDSRYAKLLADYEDELTDMVLEEAQGYADDGQYRLAMETLCTLQDANLFDRVGDEMAHYRRELGQTTIAAGLRYSAAVRSDGTVALAGTARAERPACDVSSWRNMTSVALGDSHIIGLCEDGTVVGSGPAEYYYAVSDWQNIVAIAAGDTHSVGLTADGTLVAIGENFKGECDVDGLYGDSPVVAVSAGYEFTVALHADGTVSAIGGNTHGQCNVSGWRDVVAISTGTFHTVGVTSDGRVLSAGSDDEGQCRVSGWSNIVAVSAGDYFTMGLRADGSVVAVGMNAKGQCDVGSWRNITEIAAGNHQAIGRDAYGDLYSVGGNQYKQRDFSN